MSKFSLFPKKNKGDSFAVPVVLANAALQEKVNRITDEIDLGMPEERIIQLMINFERSKSGLGLFPTPEEGNN